MGFKPGPTPEEFAELTQRVALMSACADVVADRVVKIEKVLRQDPGVVMTYVVSETIEVIQTYWPSFLASDRQVIRRDLDRYIGESQSDDPSIKEWVALRHWIANQ
jgi:hypothetical protein